MTNLRVKLTSIKINFNGTQIVDFHSSNFLSVPFCTFLLEKRKMVMHSSRVVFFFFSEVIFFFLSPFNLPFLLNILSFLSQKSAHIIHGWIVTVEKLIGLFAIFSWKSGSANVPVPRLFGRISAKKFYTFEVLDSRYTRRWHKFLIWLNVWVLSLFF